MTAQRARQAALLPDPGGRLSAVVCRAVGALGEGRLAAGDLHHHYHGGLPGLEDLHHRQPAIIDPRWFSDWLDPLAPLPALLELVREPYDGPFREALRQHPGEQRSQRRSGGPDTPIGERAVLTTEAAAGWIPLPVLISWSRVGVCARSRKTLRSEAAQGVLRNRLDPQHPRNRVLAVPFSRPK